MRSDRGINRLSRASTRAIESISRLFTGQKGTRLDPPSPFKDPLNAAPANGAPLTVMVAVVNGVEAKVESCDSCQLFNRRLRKRLSVVTAGAQMELTTSRCR